jgi:hypothetical protein
MADVGPRSGTFSDWSMVMEKPESHTLLSPNTSIFEEKRSLPQNALRRNDETRPRI